MLCRKLKWLKLTIYLLCIFGLFACGSGGGGSSSGQSDSGNPTFGGITSVSDIRFNSALLGWTAAEDTESSASQILYNIYLSTTSGQQDFNTPFWQTDPGITSERISDLEPDTEYFVVVRALDADGNEDNNQTELSLKTAALSLQLVTPETPLILIENQLFQWEIQTAYQGEGSLSYELTSGPDGLTLDATEGILEWTPSTAQAGSESTVEVQVTDGTLSDTGVITLNVAALTSLSLERGQNTITVNESGSTLNGTTLTAPSEADSSLLDAATISTVSANPFLFDGATTVSSVFVIQAPDSLDAAYTLRIPVSSLPDDNSTFKLVSLTHADDTNIGQEDSGTTQLQIALEGTLDQSGTSIEFIINSLKGFWILIFEEKGTVTTETFSNDSLSVTITDEGEGNTRFTTQSVFDWLVAGNTHFQTIGFSPPSQLDVKISKICRSESHTVTKKFSEECPSGTTQSSRVLGFVNSANPNLIHLNFDVSPVNMQVTTVHEYFHSAQLTALDTRIGSLGRWVLEGSARWIEDEVFDDLNSYKSLDRLDLVITRQGLEAESYYTRFAFFKMLNTQCSSFNISNLFVNVPTTYTDSGVSRVDSLLTESGWGCTFASVPGASLSSTALGRAMLEFTYAYNYSRQDSQIEEIDSENWQMFTLPLVDLGDGDFNASVVLPRLGGTTYIFHSDADKPVEFSVNITSGNVIGNAYQYDYGLGFFQLPSTRCRRGNGNLLTSSGFASSSSGLQLQVETDADHCWAVNLANPSLTDDASFSLKATQNLLGTVTGVVRDAVTGDALSAVSVVATQNGQSSASTTTDSAGAYTLEIPASVVHTLTFTRNDYFPEVFEGVEVAANQTIILEAVLNIQELFAGVGTATGTITNALTGEVESGVSLSFRDGINARTGQVVASTTTDTSGNYSIDLDVGNYTAQLSKDGFSDNYITVTVLGGETNGNQNGTISPTVAQGETRVVLTWGSSPSDLDSHMTGPNSSGSDRFHVYWRDRGTSSSSPFTFLDVDDISSFGPETITISQQFDGVYRYSVHDFSNRSSSSSSALALSGAKVLVIQGETTLGTFNVPNSSGTLWTVFELNGSTITPINTMSFHSNDVTIQRQQGTANDADLIRNLPDKQ